jgi:hypothetical protein
MGIAEPVNSSLLGIAENIGYAAYLAVFEADLDAARMVGRTGKDIFYNTDRFLAGALVFFQDDLYFQSRVYICSVCASHLGNGKEQRYMSLCLAIK